MRSIQYVVDTEYWWYEHWTAIQDMVKEKMKHWTGLKDWKITLILFDPQDDTRSGEDTLKEVDREKKTLKMAYGYKVDYYSSKAWIEEETDAIMAEFAKFEGEQGTQTIGASQNMSKPRKRV